MAATRDVIALTDQKASTVTVLSLHTGSLLHQYTGPRGSPLSFAFEGFYSGLCAYSRPAGPSAAPPRPSDAASLLVCDYGNKLVRDVTVGGDWVRDIGSGVVQGPQAVTTNGSVIVVSECWEDDEWYSRLTVLACSDGTLIRTIGTIRQSWQWGRPIEQSSWCCHHSGRAAGAGC